MLSYWILRDRKNAPVGLVRAEDDRVMLQLKKPFGEQTFTLFSETDAVALEPGTETRLIGALAVLGTENGRVTCFAAAQNAGPLARYQKMLSQIYTKAETQPPESRKPESEQPSVDARPFELSRKSTIEAAESVESVASEPEKPNDLSQNSTIAEPPSVTETARETEEFSLLLRRADDFFGRYARQTPSDVDNMVQKEDKSEETNGIDLFPQAFPGARWRYVDGTDVLGHYEGVFRQANGTNLHVLAVRGRAAPCPPRMLTGFTRYLRAPDGTGYWIKVTPLP